MTTPRNDAKCNVDGADAPAAGAAGDTGPDGRPAARHRGGGSRRPRALRRALALGAASVLVVGAAACAEEEDAPAEEESVVTEDAEDTADAEDAEDAAAEGDTVTIEMYDYGYRMPDTVAVGSILEVSNESEEEVHEVVLFRLADDEDRDAEELVGLPPEEMQAAGEMVGVGAALPGDEDVMYPLGELAVSDPGRYLAFCVIPIGADPQEWWEVAQEGQGPPDVPGGPPHIVEGMWVEFTVE